jgi:hypothetical protein
VARNRTRLIDWEEALQEHGHVEGALAGTVEQLGALGGGSGPLSGWIRASTDQPPQVEISVNGITVATTTAARTAEGGVSSFALNCWQLHEYLGDGDELVVHSGSTVLPFPSGGRALRVHTGYPGRTTALHRRLEQGAVFTKAGKLRRGHTPSSKRRTVELFEDVGSIVAGETGRPTVAMYGNLLGAVREHDFIGHDVGGFDIAYLSRHRHPETVREEMLGVARALVAANYHLVLAPWSIMVRRRARDPIFVDLNVAWLSPSEELQLSYGWRYAPAKGEGDFLFPRLAPLAGGLVAVPGNAEDVLHQIYGPSWIYPDQGFELEHRLLRDEAYLLTSQQLADFAQAHPTAVELAPG